MNTETQTVKVGWWTSFWMFLSNLFKTKDTTDLLPNQVEWSEFLSRIRDEDLTNVHTLLDRLKVVDMDVPLALVAVGSTLNNQKAYYRDIDFYLLPIHEHNIGLAERVFASFIQEQPETRKKHAHDEPEELSPYYEATRCWNLDFRQPTAPIHLMVLTDIDRSSAYSRLTLEGFLKHEIRRFSYRKDEKLFSAIALSEYTDQ